MVDELGASLRLAAKPRLTSGEAMSTPELALLLFAVWTISVPLGAVGWHRLGHVWRRTAAMNDFRSDDVKGPDWYRRAMRAHANCVENLPVFATLVLVLSVNGVESPLANGLAAAIVPARVVQSLVHISLTETERTVSLRFSAFLVQLACMFGLAGVAGFAHV